MSTEPGRVGKGGNTLILCEECGKPAGGQFGGQELCRKCMLVAAKRRFTNIVNNEDVQQYLEDNI